MRGNAIEIKQVGVADAEALQTIAVEAYSDHYLDTWNDNGAWYLQTFFTVEHLREELQDPASRFYIVYMQAEAVGFLKLNIDKPLPGSNKSAIELERIYLIHKASGKGIGAALMQFVFDVAQEEKAELVWLKVMDTSPAAVRFYEKMGFAKCGTHQVTFAQKKEGMRGMYLMQKTM